MLLKSTENIYTLFASTSDDTLKNYLKKISKVKLLTQEEEYRLGKLCKEGNLSAKKELAQANLRLVINIAKKYKNRGLSLIDLIQEGNIGLLKAVERYDYALGFRFTTYATWWIRQTISKSIAEQSKSVKLPVHMFDIINRMIAKKRELEQENCSDIMIKLSKSFDMPKNKIEELLNISSLMISIDSEIKNINGDKSSLVDFLEDKDDCSEEMAISNNLKVDLLNSLKKLKKREGYVLMLRFGLKNGVTHTLEEIGKLFGVTKECIRQTELRALKRLRKSKNHSSTLMSYL